MTKSITLNYAVAALVALALVFFSVAPAYAAINSSKIKIEAKNSGSILNVTSSKASTGGNTAEGSYGGNGGSGGDVSANADADGYHADAEATGNNGGALAGDGGNGGNADIGGYVSTGKATSVADSQNGLNSTDVELDVDGDMNSTYLDIEADNDPYGDCECNHIDNTTKSRARTGGNDANGSEGGRGGRGGDIEADADGDYGGDAETTGNNGGAVAGNGGTGGTGAAGGEVFTGDADSTSTTVNLLNTLLVKLSIL